MKKKVIRIISGIGALVALAMIAACASPKDSSNLSADASRNISGTENVLGSAGKFAVFGGSAGVINQGTNTAISGDVGTTAASTMITGFHSATFKYGETAQNSASISGSVYTSAPQGTVADYKVALKAAADILSAFNTLAAVPSGFDPGAGQLGGLTLGPGVYKATSGAFMITGSNLTLDAKGNADGVFVFQMSNTLTVGAPLAPCNVVLINGAQAKNVYWQVGNTATINGSGGGRMVGTIIARSGIVFSASGNQQITSLNGRALSVGGVITMVNTIISNNNFTIVLPTTIPQTPALYSKAPAVSPRVTITGSAAANVLAEAGAGTITITNNGGRVSAKEIGTGSINIVNNGGILNATNTGSGTMLITSNATGTVTISNIGNGRVTVNATGASLVNITHTGDEDFYYP